MAPEPVILGDDGMLDMEQFPDDELDPATESDVRQALLSDPVEEPSDEVWDDMFDHALAEAEPAGPFDADPVDLGADAVDASGEAVRPFDAGTDDPGDAGDVDTDHDDLDGPDDLVVGDDGDDGLPDADRGSDVLEDPGDTLEDFY